MIKLVDLCNMVEKKFLSKAITLKETTKYCGAGILHEGKIIDYENDYTTLYRIYDVETAETNECDQMNGHKLLLIFSDDCEYVQRYTIIGCGNVLGNSISELFNIADKETRLE